MDKISTLKRITVKKIIILIPLLFTVNQSISMHRKAMMNMHRKNDDYAQKHRYSAHDQKNKNKKRKIATSGKEIVLPQSKISTINPGYYAPQSTHFPITFGTNVSSPTMMKFLLITALLSATLVEGAVTPPSIPNQKQKQQIYHHDPAIDLIVNHPEYLQHEAQYYPDNDPHIIIVDGNGPEHHPALPPYKPKPQTPWFGHGVQAPGN